MTTLAQKTAAALAEQWARPVVDKVRLLLPPPPSTNALYRNATAAESRNGRAGRVKTQRYRIWLQAAGNALNRQRPGRVPGAYRIVILLPRGHTGIDTDNVKAVSDLLQTHRVIDNDNLAEWIAIGWTNEPDCIVTVTAERGNDT